MKGNRQGSLSRAIKGLFETFSRSFKKSFRLSKKSVDFFDSLSGPAALSQQARWELRPAQAVSSAAGAGVGAGSTWVGAGSSARW